MALYAASLPLRLPGLLLLVIVLLATTLAVDPVHGQPTPSPEEAPAPAPEAASVDTWILYYTSAAVYLYGSTLSCASGQVVTNRTGGQLWCAGALSQGCELPPVARWGCLLSNPAFLYDIYKKSGSNLYYFQVRSRGWCINMHCARVATPLIIHDCNTDNTDQQFELEYVGDAPGCSPPYNKLFRLVEPIISVGGYQGCVTTGPEQISNQMCNNYVEETQTFFIRPVPT